MLQLLEGDARNNERDCARALYSMGVQVGEVVNESKSGTGRDPGEHELPVVGDAVDLYLRDVAGIELDVRVEQDVATLRFKGEAGIGTERDIHSTSSLRQAYGADAAGEAEVVVGQLDYVGRCKRNREGQQKEQEKQVKASHSHIPGVEFDLVKSTL